MASYGINILNLESMSHAVTVELYKIYFRFLKGNDSFPYIEVERLLDRYELLYCKTFRESVLNRFLRSVNGREIDNDFVRLSKDEIVISVSKRILGEVYFDVDKYVPKNDLDQERVLDKLFPILRNFSPYEIADVYVRFKRSASLRKVIIDDESRARLQQIFVSSIMAVLSSNLNNKDIDFNSLCNYDYVCEKILLEPVISFNNAKKKVR